MADIEQPRSGIAPAARDLAGVYRAGRSELAGHQQAEGVQVGPDGITVLCSTDPRGDGEQTRLIRLSHEGDVVWEREYASEQGAGRAIAALPTGGFAIAGDLQGSELEYRAHLLHVDAEGQVVAGRAFGPAGVTGFVAVAVLEDGSTLAAGMADGRGSLLSSDGALETRWELTLEDVDTVRALAPVGTGFALAASQDESTTGLGMTRLARFAAERQLRWERRVPASGRGEPAALDSLEGGLVMVGYRSAGDRDATRCWILRLGADGEPLWENLIGADGEERRGRAVSALADGGVVVASDGLRDGRRSVYVSRLTADGSSLWERSHSGGERAQDVAHDVACTADGGFVLVGSTRGEGAGKTKARVLRLDGEGRLLWDRSFGGSA